MAKRMRIVDRLKAVRALLSQPERWFQRGFKSNRADENGDLFSCYCLVGALNAVSNRDTDASYVVNQFQAVPRSEVKALGFKSVYEITYWNDAPGRTVRGVLNRLSRAINELEAA
jgi:hypothetical protein